MRKVPVIPPLHYYSGKPVTEIKALAENGMIVFLDQNDKQIDTPTGNWDLLRKFTDAEIVAYCDAWISWNIDTPLPDACRVHGVNVG